MARAPQYTLHALTMADGSRVQQYVGSHGQVFAVRNNEIFLMSQPRPERSVHRSEGWTPETVASHALPALQASYYDLDRSGDVFTWDPV